MIEKWKNAQGATIYKNVKRHKFLDMPAISDPHQEKGAVHEVLSVGLSGIQRTAIVTVKEPSGKAVAYRLPDELNGWVENNMMLANDNMNPFPSQVEFGEVNGRPYAEML